MKNCCKGSQSTSGKGMIIGIAVFLAVLGAIWFASPGAPGLSSGNSGNSGAGTAVGSGSLTVVGPSKHDFGRISMAAGPVTKVFRIKNQSGSVTASVTKLYTSCMCTKAKLIAAGRQWGPYGMPAHGFIPSINQPLGPGEEAEVEVVFDPAAHGPAGVGPIQRAVTIENGGGRPLELNFSAMVTP